MGCGVSNVGCRVSSQKPPAEEALMKVASCKIVFSQQHLLRLNKKFLSLLDNQVQTGRAKEKQTARLGVIVERLIQRLICNLGQLDSRFSSKFLINLEPLKSYEEPKECLKYKYLVRLDLVSTPALYPEFFEPPIRIIEGTDHKLLPQGYAKIRVHGEFLEQWTGFISPTGFLRRDKIQEKFLELLAKAAARPSEPFSPAQVDESKHCGSPGKVIDPITVSQILKTPASEQVFYGSAECNESRFPDPRDFRIAIVEGLPETRLHVSFLSPTAQCVTSEDAEISLTLGIGVNGWPLGSDFPLRLPLDHIDVLLGYRAAQLGYYLVPKGPHPSVYCEDRFSVWEIRTLPTEMFLEHHYSPTSVVTNVYKILIHILGILKARGVKTVNKYIIKNLLFFELEQKNRIQLWKPKLISRRVISILEKLLISLKTQMISSYIFPKKNILLQNEVFDDDYASDRDILENYLRQLHSDELKIDFDDISKYYSAKEELENVLLKKWENVLVNMIPPQSNKTKRMNIVNNSPVVISYTRQQIEYVASLLREILKLKNIQRINAMRDVPYFEETKKLQSNDKEDFIYLLQIMFHQAKQKLQSPSLNKKASNRKLLKLDQLLLSYDLSAAMILDDIRRDKITNYSFPDDLSMVTKIMEFLYKAMDSDGKVLGPVLRPYLNQIFKGSHENCWFLFEWNKKADLSEFEAIRIFSKLALLGSIDPVNGIFSSASKGWNWATNCVQIMQAIKRENSTKLIVGDKIDITHSGLRLIFTPAPGKTIRLTASINETSAKKASKALSETINEKQKTNSYYATIRSFQDVLESTISTTEVENSLDGSSTKEMVPVKNLLIKNEEEPLHIQLRKGNPFTMASIETRRQGNHRGLGSIVQALISLQKLTILQEISQYLPEEEKNRVLSDIKKLSKEVQRAAVENYKKKKSFTFSDRRNRFIVKQNSANTFTPRFISQKKILKAFPNTTKTSEPQMSGTYRSLNEFSVSTEKEIIEKEIKNRAEQLDEELKKLKKETLRGTCRELRKRSRPAAVGPSTSCIFHKPGFNRKGSILPKSIHTPFYIQVSSTECKFNFDTCRCSKTIKP